MSEINNNELNIHTFLAYTNNELSEQKAKKVKAIIDNTSFYRDAYEGFVILSKIISVNKETLAILLEDVDKTVNEAIKKIEDGMVEREFLKDPSMQFTYEQLLQLFKAVPYYEESLENQVERSHSNFVVLSPALGINCKNQILFTFKILPPANTVLVIEDNQEEKLSEHAIDALNHQCIIDISKLGPGRYYWRLEIDKKLHKMGKFFIRKDLMPKELAA